MEGNRGYSSAGAMGKRGEEAGGMVWAEGGDSSLMGGSSAIS
jgi:hypothetical protein